MNCYGRQFGKLPSCTGCASRKYCATAKDKAVFSFTKTDAREDCAEADFIYFDEIKKCSKEEHNAERLFSFLKSVANNERIFRIVFLRLRGCTYEEIAKRTGKTRQAMNKLLKMAIEKHCPDCLAFFFPKNKNRKK